MDSISIQKTGSAASRYDNRVASGPEGWGAARIRRIEVTDRHYAVEVYEDERGETWVRVKTDQHVSAPIPFSDFVVANQ